jgi:hypothetical protein
MTGRWTYRVSATGVLLLAAAAFTLSYDALHQLALDSRVRPALAWLWPVVIDGTIVVALLTVLAAKRATTRAGYPWALAGLFSAASVAFNIAHAPDRPVAQLVFAMAPIALVLTTHLLMQQASWRYYRPMPDRPRPVAAHEAGPEPAHPHPPADHPAPRPPRAEQSAQLGARAQVRAAYQAQLAAGQTPTGAGLARAVGVSERYGQRLLAEFTADPARADYPNGHRRAAGRQPITTAKGGDHGPAVDPAAGRRPARHLAPLRAPARVSAPHPLRQGWPARAHRHQRPGRLHRRRPGRGPETAEIATASECLAWPTSSDASATAR